MKVMTPLLGTKTPSEPAGDKSGGDRRAARAAAFQVFTKHETRDPRHGDSLARGASQREFRGFHETRITKHESRLLCFSRITAFFRPGRAKGGATGNRRPDRCPRRQAAVFQFTIVHHCSPLFTIVRHCSPLFSKKLSCASVFAPPSRCFPCARSRGMVRLWRGMGGRRPPRRQHGL